MKQTASIIQIEELFLSCSNPEPNPQVMRELLANYNFTSSTIQKALELCEVGSQHTERGRICKHLLQYEYMVITRNAFHT